MDNFKNIAILLHYEGIDVRRWYPIYKQKVVSVWQIRYDLLEPRPESRMCYNIQSYIYIYIFHFALLNQQKVGWNRHHGADIHIHVYVN